MTPPATKVREPTKCSCRTQKRPRLSRVLVVVLRPRESRSLCNQTNQNKLVAGHRTLCGHGNPNAPRTKDDSKFRNLGLAYSPTGWKPMVRYSTPRCFLTFYSSTCGYCRIQSDFAIRHWIPRAPAWRPANFVARPIAESSVAWPPACDHALWAQEEEMKIGKGPISQDRGVATLAKVNGSELPRIPLPGPKM